MERVLRGTRELPAEVCDPEESRFTLEVDNPYLPYRPGQTSVLEGTRGQRTMRVQITVLTEPVTVAGVTTLVVEEREWVDDELVEVSRNFVAQTTDGTVCYFGEDVDDYRAGEVVGHGGAWWAGVNDAKPGILMPGTPEVGTFYQQERAPGVAEDGAVIVAIGEAFTTPAGTFTDTLVTNDVDPMRGRIDPKRYAREVGLIVDEEMALTSFEP